MCKFSSKQYFGLSVQIRSTQDRERGSHEDDTSTKIGLCRIDGELR